MPKSLLIGWDAADWKVIRPLMEAGRMPNVRRLVEQGASGQIATLHPPLSPMLWTSIATGKRPFKHGIHGFSEPGPDGRGVRAVTNLSRKTKALWNILHQDGLRSVVIGWWPSYPAEPIDGVMVSDQFHRAGRPLEEGWPLETGTVHPPELDATLGALRVHPDSLTPDLVEPFIPLAREVDQDKDRRLANCLRTLAECMSIQAAALWLIERQPWDLFAVYFDSIDHFCHGFMRYHPPRQARVNARDFELYGGVVAAAYELQDRMLGELVAKTDEDTHVVLVSDHGFHPDHLRPASIPDVPAGPAVEHRDLGIVAIRGPRIKAGETLYGASILDITPTILTLHGLPTGEDMDGKPLFQAFVNAPSVEWIPSWDLVPGADGCHPPQARLDPVAAHAALERMIALGYIETPDENGQWAAERTVRELRYNLGESHQDGGRHAEAREIFSELYRICPQEQRFAVKLFVSCQALGQRSEMRRIVDEMDGPRRRLYEEAKIGLCRRPSNPEEQREHARWRDLVRYQPAVTDYLKSQLLIAEKRYEEALAVLESLPNSASVLLETAALYLRRGRRTEAKLAYEGVLALDPDSAPAYLGLCGIALRGRDYRSAAHAALNAVERAPHDPLAHYLLGRALETRNGAVDAYCAAVALNPNFPRAHLRLAALLGNGDAGREHRLLARRMRGRRVPADMGHAHDVQPLAAANLNSPACDRMPPLDGCLIAVTGLPRSGTSMLMQMLAAGGMPVLADGVRECDSHNPRGYLEFEPIKKLPAAPDCLYGARGKAVKIIAPLMGALPIDLPCRAILCERDLDEVLDSQERMLGHHDPSGQRRMLHDEYVRILDRLKATLESRAQTAVLVVDYAQTVGDPIGTAQRVNAFLGGRLDTAAMSRAIDPALYRNRAAARAVAVCT